MLIITQDKKHLFDISGMYFYCSSERKIIASSTANPSNWYILCGTYSTEEKAIKVLDMIQGRYITCPYAEKDGIPHSAPFPKVFHMPQESEV